MIIQKQKYNNNWHCLFIILVSKYISVLQSQITSLQGVGLLGGGAEDGEWDSRKGGFGREKEKEGGKREGRVGEKEMEGV